MRKICFVVPQAYLFFNPTVGVPFGGAERQVYYLGTELAARSEYEVHYCVADFGQQTVEVKENCYLWNAFNFSESKLIAFMKICATLRKINAEIYIFRAANSAIFPLVSFLKYVFRKKCLYMVAHQSEGSFEGLVKMTNFPTAILMSRVYSMVDILCVQTKEQLSLFSGKNTCGAHLVPNIFQFLHLGDTIRKGFDFSLWVGRAESWKRPELFLELARRNPCEKFIMVCPSGGEPNYYCKLQGEAATLPNLIFSGGMTPLELFEHYLRAKLYVLTSEAEGFANTMMEAMACACPILSLGINPDGIITQNKMGLVANNTKEFFNMFSRLAGNAKYCETLGESGRKYLLANHVGESAISRFAKLLT